MAKTLFYSHTENILFLIPNYYPDQTYNVSTHIDMLMEHAKELADIAGVDVKLVSSKHINESRSYKHMRVWWVSVEKPHPGAFVIGDTGHKWTMEEWLRS